jgi:hypothetical protein
MTAPPACFDSTTFTPSTCYTLITPYTLPLYSKIHRAKDSEDFLESRWFPLYMHYASLSEGFSLVDTETPRAVPTFSNMFWKYDLVGNLNRNTRPPLKDKN